MKKGSDIINLLEKGINIKIQEELDRKNLLAIKQISAESRKIKKPVFFFRPAVAFGIAAVVVAVFSMMYIFSNIKGEDNTIAETQVENNEQRANILLSEDNNNSEQATDVYAEEVSNAAIKTTSGGIILSWENPDDESFKEVKIEKFINKEDFILVYAGNLNMYIDKDSNEALHYLIKSVDIKGNISEGVQVELPEE